MSDNDTLNKIKGLPYKHSYIYLVIPFILSLVLFYIYDHDIEYIVDKLMNYLTGFIYFILLFSFSSLVTMRFAFSKNYKEIYGNVKLLIFKKRIQETLLADFIAELNGIDSKIPDMKDEKRVAIYYRVVTLEIGLMASYLRLVLSDYFKKNLYKTNKSTINYIILETNETSNIIEVLLQECRYQIKSHEFLFSQYIVNSYKLHRKSIFDLFINKLSIALKNAETPYDCLIIWDNYLLQYMKEYLHYTEKWINSINGEFDGYYAYAKFSGYVVHDWHYGKIAIDKDMGIGVLVMYESHKLHHHRKMGLEILDIVKESSIYSWIFDLRISGIFGNSISEFWDNEFVERASTLNVEYIAFVNPRDEYALSILDASTIRLKKNFLTNNLKTVEQALKWIFISRIFNDYDAKGVP